MHRPLVRQWLPLVFMLALMLVSGAQTASAVSLVTNGSFEGYTGPAPAAGDNAVQVSIGGGLTGWSNTNIGEALVFPSWYSTGTVFACCGGVGLAGYPTFPQSSPDGGNFILSDGNFMNSPLTQTITGLNPGDSYLLTFYQALVQDIQPYPSSSYFITVPGPVTGGWQVTLGTNTQFSPSMAANGAIPTFSPWAQQSMVFTAQNATEILSFFSFGTGDPPLVGLDGVSLVAVDTGVPEPTGLLLIGAGVVLAARGIKVRRRRA